MAPGTNDPPEVKPDQATQKELDDIRSATEKAAETISDVYDAINDPARAAQTMGEHGSRIWAGVQALGLAQGNDTRNEWNKRVKQAFRVGQIAGGWTPEQIEWSEGQSEEGEDDEMGSGNVSVHGDTIINVSPEITRTRGQNGGRKKKPDPTPQPAPTPAPAPAPPSNGSQPSLLARMAGPALIATGLGLGGWAIGSGLANRPQPTPDRGQVEGYSTIRLFSDEDVEE